MNDLPWIEKYRPKDLETIVGNQSAIQQFKIIAQNGNIPHMILSGSPGTGKTTSIICLSKILLKDEFHNAFLELNASDERGIDVIRSKITTFCKKKIMLPESRHKIIFLDEVDSMTSTAQQALRRIIELHAATTRFVMACNTSTKIIEAIQSRCSVIRFTKIGIDDMKKRLIEICNMEKVEYKDDGIDLLLTGSDGDMRRSINYLQSIAITYGKIDKDSVSNIIDRVDNVVIQKLVNKCFEKQFEEVDKIITKLIEDGYSSMDIIQLLFLKIKDKKMDQNIKLKIVSEIGKIQMNLIQGGNPYLQLLSLVSRIIMITS